MSRKLPPLNALRAFEAAARHLSFTRAAAELHVTQAAISHQVKALEEHLGLPLFRRLTRALLLTDEGQSLFAAARDALDALSAATARIKAADGDRTLTVSMLPSVAAKWFVPRMSRFQDRYPDIDLRITAGERLVDLAREGIDVAIRFGGGAWPGLHIEVLAAEAVTPLCSPALAATLHRPADLAHATLLHEDWEPFDNFPSWQDWLAAAKVTGVDVRRGPRFSHSHMMLHAAIDGHGVALGQLVLARDDIAAGRLAAPFPLCLPVGYAHYLVCLPSAAARPKIKAFRDWLVAEMARTVAESALAQPPEATTAP